MQKTAKASKQLCATLKNVLVGKRLFLSEAYRCQEAWERRLETPLLRKIDPVKLFFEIGQKFSSAGKVSAIDVDLFANTITADNHAEEVTNMLKGLRLSPETSNTLESTHHAVIRYLLSKNQTETLLEVLHDRYQYGVFPDHFTYNLLMDTFVKSKDFASAAKVAVLLMLQEDSEHPISNALCVYSCFKYLENPSEWQEPEVKRGEGGGGEEEDDDGEEVKVRVKYIRNPFFDDHFDLRNPLDLVGKTLAFQGKHMDDPLGRSCQLRGLLLYKKYAAVEKLINKWLRQHNDQEVLYKDVFDLIANDGAHIPEGGATEGYKSLESLLAKLKESKLCRDSLLESIEKRVKTAVDAQAQKDMDAQCRVYIDWENTRTLVLDKQRTEMDKISRLAKVAEMKKDLEETERILTFFECEEAIELEIEKLEAKERQEIERLGDRLKKLKTEDFEYIPQIVQKKKK